MPAAALPTPRSAAELKQDGLDLLSRFISHVDPSVIAQLDSSSAGASSASSSSSEEAIESWPLLHSPAPSLVIRRHATRPLFSVQAFLPNVEARQFWCLMSSVDNRKLWDASIEFAEVKQTFEEDDVTRACYLRVEEMRFGSIFMVAKPRSMVLLSMDAQLAPTPTSALRFLSVSGSTPSAPPPRTHTRFELSIGGFLVESLTREAASSLGYGDSAGVRVTQLSDLGEVASWVPSSVVKLVSANLVPRSLASIAKVAAGLGVPYAIRGDEPPPRSEKDLAKVEKVAGGAVWDVKRGIPWDVHRIGEALASTGLEVEDHLGSEDSEALLLLQAAPESASPAPSIAPSTPLRSPSVLSSSSSTSFSQGKVRRGLSGSTLTHGIHGGSGSVALTLQRLSTRLASPHGSPVKERGASRSRVGSHSGFPFGHASSFTPGYSPRESEDGLSALDDEQSTFGGLSASVSGTSDGVWRGAGSLSGTETVPGTPTDEALSLSDTDTSDVDDDDDDGERNSDEDAGDVTLRALASPARSVRSRRSYASVGAGAASVAPASPLLEAADEEVDLAASTEMRTPSLAKSQPRRLEGVPVSPLAQRTAKVNASPLALRRARLQASTKSNNRLSRAAEETDLDLGAHIRRMTTLFSDELNVSSRTSSPTKDSPAQSSAQDDTYGAQIEDLLADALHSSLMPPGPPRRGGANASKRLSAAQRDAKRLSTILILGSDALAMALAPGARESLALSPPNGSQEWSRGLASMQEWAEGVEERSRPTSGSGLTENRSTPSVSDSLSEATYSARSSASLSSRSVPQTRIGRISPSVASADVSQVSAFYSSASGSVLLSAPAALAQRGRLSSGISQSAESQPSPGLQQKHSKRGGSAWTSLAETPYALALGMYNMSYIARARREEDADAQAIDGSERLARDGLGAARRALLAASKRADARPARSKSREIAPARAESSPSSSAVSSTSSGPLAADATANDSGFAASASRRSSYSLNDAKLHPFPGSLGRATGSGAMLPPLGTNHQFMERAPDRPPGTLSPTVSLSSSPDAMQQGAPASQASYLGAGFSYLSSYLGVRKPSS